MANRFDNNFPKNVGRIKKENYAQLEKESIWFMYVMGKQPTEIAWYFGTPLDKVKKIINKCIKEKQAQGM